MGQLIGAAFDDVKVGQAFATVMILFLTLLGGLFVQNLSIWRAMVTYASNAVILVIFQDPIPCNGFGSLSLLCEVGDTTSFVAPQAVLDTFSVTLSVGANIIPRMFAYSFLRRKKLRRKKAVIERRDNCYTKTKLRSIVIKSSYSLYRIFKKFKNTITVHF